MAPFSTFAKTDFGALAVKDRSAVKLTPRQRTALIMMDGLRQQNDFMDTVSTLGVTEEDITTLADLGLIAETRPAAARPPTQPITAAPQESPPLSFAERVAQAQQEALAQRSAAATRTSLTDEDERVRRYRAAYPIAVGITSRLGLKGFKLNLAVESATGFEGLVALLPRLREAVGTDAPLRPLQEALYGA
jgi:hypothetical protein